MNKEQNLQPDILDIRGKISIMKGTRENQRAILSNSNFFIPDEDIIVKVDHEKIIFTKPGIDYKGKTHKPKLIRSRWIIFQIVANLPIVKNLEFDLDESNIDKRIVYYNLKKEDNE